MSTNWKKTTRILAAFALLGAVIACGGDDDDGSGSTTTGTDTTTEGTAAAQPGAGGAPQTLQIGQPPVSLTIPIPPSFNLTIATAGEFQIDAMGSPMDAEIFMYQGDQLVEKNDDGGEGVNARIVRFLAPGTYSVRIVEHRSRAFTAQVQAQLLQPLTPVGSLTPGQPLQVQFPEVSFLQRPHNNREAAKSVTFNVTTSAQFTCGAAATNNRDAQMAIIQNGIVLEEDDDSGEGNNASITRQFAPGNYIIRVWDWLKRSDMTITVTCTPA